MDEAGCEVVLGEVVEEHATDICRREVKLRGQQIRRDAKKAADAEVLPDAPEAVCPDCVQWEEEEIWKKKEEVWKREEKAWEREVEILEGEKRLKDREIAHLTDRASFYEAEMRDLMASMSSSEGTSTEATEAEPPAAPSGLNEFGDVGLR